MRKLLFIFIALISTTAGAQSTAVQTSVDRDSIMMGEEILLQLAVPVTKDDLVIFPIQQNVGPLEVIESYPVDTIRENDNITLFKKYGLTQWDSGDYRIPALKVIKNNASIYSDSLMVKVREVKADTTVQKMFPIKADIENDYPKPFNWAGLLWLLLWIPLGIVFVLLSRKRTRKMYEDTLPPFEWAKYRLKLLEESKLAQNGAWKEYYTELTYILRRYIDQKVYDHALENTTDELLENLKQETAARDVSLTDKTLARLEQLLKKADLIKFAGMSGDAISAKEDRGAAHDIIYNIHQVLPPPSEDELQLDVEYRRKQDRKNKIKKIALYIGATILAIAVAIGTWIAVVGYDNFKDQLFGNELREYYDGPRYTSSYGTPSITLTTPEILKRRLDKPVGGQLALATSNIDMFSLNDMDSDLYVILMTMQFKGQGPAADEEIPAELFTEPIYTSLEEQGATNIVMLDEPAELQGFKGLKLEGTYEYDEQAFEYVVYLYIQGAAVQQVWIGNLKTNNDEEDKEYGRLLREQIVNSIELKKPQPKNDQQQ
ncbi:hypothetical protein [Nonlabens ponticola]|uniref:DUF4381 domain-containing protein n=1 Tax=Nonlabens ponticola TaxID=2496866 RepID=A0A3S9MV93_9FLAO|nr:hypothetical protein [Nonlabens ponticola]AZQ43073.1 hypothetical protein EJ995_02050 [Nonlabens ponticola]